LLFCNERMSKRLLICSFAMSQRATNCSIALFQCAEMSDEQLPNQLVRGLSICSFWKWVFAFFWVIAVFFLSEKMSYFENRSFFAHFCLFALFERAKEWLSKWLLIWKEQMSKRLLICSFAKSDWAMDCSFALLQWVNEQQSAQLLFSNEQSLAQSLFSKEWMSNKSLNCSFAMSEWATNCSVALLQWSEMSNEQMSDCPTNWLEGWAFAHFGNEHLFFFLSHRSFWKSKRVIEQVIAHVKRADKQGISQSLFCNEPISNKMLNCSFSMSKWATNCSIALAMSGNELWANELMRNCPTLLLPKALILGLKHFWKKNFIQKVIWLWSCSEFYWTNLKIFWE